MVTGTGDDRRGETFEDLAEYIRAYRAGGYDVAHVAESICGDCGGRGFEVVTDGDDGAQRICVTCGNVAFIADSADYWEEEEVGDCTCPCGGTTFAVGLGLAMREDGVDVRWISVGLRCLTDGRLGVYADWKISYGPSGHLRLQA